MQLLLDLFLSEWYKLKSYILKSNTTDHRERGWVTLPGAEVQHLGMPQAQTKHIFQQEEHTIRVQNCSWLRKTAATVAGSRPSSPCRFRGASAASLLLPDSGVAICLLPLPEGRGGQGRCSSPLVGAWAGPMQATHPSRFASRQKQMKPRGNPSCFYLTASTATKYLCAPVCFCGG